MTDAFELTAYGAFDPARSIEFLERWPAGSAEDGGDGLTFAVCAEHGWEPIGVRVTAAHRACM